MSSQHINALNSHLLFQHEAIPFNSSTTSQRRVTDPAPKTRELCGFMDDKLFPAERDRFFAHQGGDFRQSLFCDGRNWNGNGSGRTGSGKGSDEEDEDDDDDDDEDEVDDDDGDVEGLVSLDDVNKSRKTGNPNSSNNERSDQSGGGLKNGTNKLGNGKPKQHSSFGGTLLVKDGMAPPSGSNTGEAQSENHQQGRLGNYPNAVTIAEHDSEMYYSQYLQGTEGSASGHKDLAMENGCGFGRRDVFLLGEPGESLRAILTDPVTGSLMDDAMILPCGHSFGSGGIEHVLRLKSCYTCSQLVSEDLIAQNLSLQAAVRAFRREEELLFYRSPKRRRERFEQDKVGYSDSTMGTRRGRGVQFPFAVTDRVIIKGNKRTPLRFVGREAVVTTQCLNGWYVVKTLDNAESVKLQYRSLAKVPNDGASKTTTSKIAPNWV
ncbi:U-box domain-containing protein 62 [Cucurbita pepo subsp. pepo]|uniref:U-box domain-containing protein 62 n=1 Tax=Cucurbita pepo subsp. pepo TaxID=3664 RepID=UPI000C9D2F63|nr:U-box domain-containing protein 62 [Cucurbita pepo subsp. pepo]